MFQCRVAKEIWELSPLSIPSGQYTEAHSLFDIVQDLLAPKAKEKSKDLLFPYIGWRIWKARNDLLFNSKRWPIPDIIHKGLLDWRLWTDSINTNYLHPLQPKLQKTSPPSNAPLHVDSQFYCCTDGSWINPKSKVGIGWALFDAQHRNILQGYSSLEPTSSAIEAETLALREALLQLRRLNYRNVTLCGDSSTLFHYLEQVEQYNEPNSGHIEIQAYLEDILTMAEDFYYFKFIPRHFNVLADRLAKEARLKNSPMVVSWVC